MSSKLVEMELDEISLVKRGANQHATVSIAKSLASEEEEMGNLFFEDGTPVDEDDLELGETVFDEDGNAFLVEEDNEDDYEDDEDGDYEDDDVEKSLAGRGAKLFGSAKNQFGAAKKAARGGWASGTGVRRGMNEPLSGSRAFNGAQHVSRNRNSYIAGAAGVAGAGAGTGVYANRRKDRVNKSWDLREEFSKALTDGDRDEVIAKAFSQIEELEYSNNEALEIAKAEQELRVFNEYVGIAKSYTLPFEDEVVANAMMEAEAMLSEEAVDVIVKSFEIASQLIGEEIGYDGGTEVMYAVNGALDEFGKSDDPESIVKTLETNPELYDAYLAEQQYR